MSVCHEYSNDALMFEETTVVIQHLCGVCETTLGEPVFTQKRRVIWELESDVEATEPQRAAFKNDIHKDSQSLPTEGQVAARLQVNAMPLWQDTARSYVI